MAGRLVRSRAWRSTDDTAAMQALLSRGLATDWPAVRMHPGDLDWWTVQAWGSDRPDIRERARLWFATPRDAIGADSRRASGSAEDHGPALIAFAWYTPPGDVDVILDAGLAARSRRTSQAVVREALAWTEERHGHLDAGHPAPTRAWAARDSAEAAALARLGLIATVEGDAYVQLTGPAAGSALSASAVPGGLEVRPIGDADVDARVRCSRAAFTTSTMTTERYRRTFLGRSYRPDLDLVVVDGSGSVLAFALGWYDEATRIVELEPVGVDPRHQRRGLGALICRSVIRRASGLGATRLMIAADRSNEAAVGLYRSLGLEITSVIVPFGPAAAIASPDRR